MPDVLLLLPPPGEPVFTVAVALAPPNPTPAVAEAEPFVDQRLVDLWILDVDLFGVQALWTIEKLRRRMPST